MRTFTLILFYGLLLIASVAIATAGTHNAPLASAPASCPCGPDCKCSPCRCRESCETLDGKLAKRVIHRIVHPLQPMPKPAPKPA